MFTLWWISQQIKCLSAFGNVELRIGRSHLVIKGFLWGISPLPSSFTGSLITYLSFRCSAGFSSGIWQITDCYGYGKQTLKRALNSAKWWKASVTLCFRNWTRKIELTASVMRSLSVETRAGTLRHEFCSQDDAFWAQASLQCLRMVTQSSQILNWGKNSLLVLTDG